MLRLTGWQLYVLAPRCFLLFPNVAEYRIQIVAELSGVLLTQFSRLFNDWISLHFHVRVLEPRGWESREFLIARVNLNTHGFQGCHTE